MTIVSYAPEQIKEAASVIQKGNLVAFPTETVYGLGADATCDAAVAKIYEAKGRPKFNPIISHLSSTDEAFEIGVFSSIARDLAMKFWPGPLTLIIQRAPNCPISWLASAGLETIGIRVPNHPVALELLRLAKLPIAAPSANLSGSISPTHSKHVEQEFDDRIKIILEGGNCEVGLESTVLDLSGVQPAVLRPGKITKENIEELIGPITQANEKTVVSSPGMLSSHYAPKSLLRLNAESLREGEAFLGFGQICYSPFPNLSPQGDLAEAAANLFHLLREIDKTEPRCIAVAPIPCHGLGTAINDRLNRAAAPRQTSYPVDREC